MTVSVKICGLKEAGDVAVAVKAGARYLGFNFFEPSPRYVTPEQAASLCREVPPGVAKVALSVDAGNGFLDALTAAMPVDILQLHGKEPPERVQELKARYGLPVMKAIGVAEEADLPALNDYARVADMILVDAKKPKGSVLPGGNGLTFDWRLIAGRRWAVPWMLAGGLTPENVAEAVARTGARQVDVSSGVETAPGVKDAGLIRAFLGAAHAAEDAAPPNLMS